MGRIRFGIRFVLWINNCINQLHDAVRFLHLFKFGLVVLGVSTPRAAGNREIPCCFFVESPKTTFSLCASGDLSASCVGSASQAITMQRADTAKQINFLVSIDSFHQTFGLAPPPQLFGYLSASAAVSSFYRCYAVIVYWGNPPR